VVTHQKTHRLGYLGGIKNHSLLENFEFENINFARKTLNYLDQNYYPINT
jgi:hypothetical protein